MLLFIYVEIAIHPLQNKMDQHGNQRQRDQECEHATRTEVLAFEPNVRTLAMMVADVLVTHVRLPEGFGNSGRTAAAAALNSDFGSTATAKILQWQTA